MSQQVNVKELEALIKMLRKHGVTEFEGHGLKMRVDVLNEKPKGNDEKIDSDPELSDEQIAMWSANGY